MSDKNIRFEGLEDILDRFEKIASTQNVQQALGQACALVEAEAKKKAPKDDGELRRSISSKIEGLQGIVFTPLDYAPYVEFGTGLFAEGGNGRKDVPWSYQDDEGNWHTINGQRPQPYMRPALEENRTQIIRILKEGISND